MYVLIRRFCSWNEALLLAGVALSNEPNISDETLFENILVLWQHLGRQPSDGKSARQAAFDRAVSQLSVAKAVSQAKLISNLNPAEFRIVRMPG